jgi:hypothetical protein
MFPNQPRRFHQVLRLPSVILRQGYDRIQPELRLPIGGLDVHVQSGLLPRKEEEPQVAVAEDRGAHPARLQTPAHG